MTSGSEKPQEKMLVVRHKHERSITVSSQSTMWEWGICEATAQLREWAEPSMRKENMNPDFKPIQAWDFQTQNQSVLAAQGHGGIPPDRAQPEFHCTASAAFIPVRHMYSLCLCKSSQHGVNSAEHAIPAQCEHTWSCHPRTVWTYLTVLSQHSMNTTEHVIPAQCENTWSYHPSTVRTQLSMPSQHSVNTPNCAIPAQWEHSWACYHMPSYHSVNTPDHVITLWCKHSQCLNHLSSDSDPCIRQSVVVFHIHKVFCFYRNKMI